MEEGCDDRKETDVNGVNGENISMLIFWIFCIVHRNGFTRIDLWELENTMLGKKSCTRCGGEWMKYEMRENSDHQADLNIYVYTYRICGSARAHIYIYGHTIRSFGWKVSLLCISLMLISFHSRHFSLFPFQFCQLQRQVHFSGSVRVIREAKRKSTLCCVLGNERFGIKTSFRWQSFANEKPNLLRSFLF